MVGVKPGDWAKFGEIQATWESTDPGAKMPDELKDGGSVSWGEIVVVDVTSTTVTLGMIQGNKDGTETKSVAQGDLATGMGNLSFFLFPKDLNKGDSLPLGATINDTLTRNYAGASREVNMLSFSSSMFGTNITNRFYFDRITGITCELWIETIVQQGEYLTTATSTMKLTETNMWQKTDIPESPMTIGFIGLLIITLTCNQIYRKSSSKLCIADRPPI